MKAKRRSKDLFISVFDIFGQHLQTKKALELSRAPRQTNKVFLCHSRQKECYPRTNLSTLSKHAKMFLWPAKIQTIPYII